MTIDIFPSGSLDGSVITTVWVGVAVVVFFNLRFGWVLSGLVVPGYLAPLILTKPWSAGVVLFESVITYLIVMMIPRLFGRWFHFHDFFGRDRFFFIILVSVMVRTVFDGWGLPWLGNLLVTHYEIGFDYQNNLHSFGLVIVALLANAYWKPGLARGLSSTLVILVVTALIIRYILVEFTNFNIGNLSFMYEDLAQSILASPKAYILLISAAFIASRMNLLYGWEYNGILIPSLLALQWHEPLKLFVTILEALVILGASATLIKLPPFNRIDIQGARLTLLFFNVGFFYKFALGYLLITFNPVVKVTDYFAFGYLLSTLVAIKIYERKEILRIGRAIIQTSLTAMLFATFIGFGFVIVSNSWLMSSGHSTSAVTDPIHAPLSISDMTLDSTIREEKVKLYKSKSSTTVLLPSPIEQVKFENGLILLKQYIHSKDDNALMGAKEQLELVSYQLIRGKDYFVLSDKKQRGWGLYSVSLKSDSASDGLYIQIPYALQQAGTIDVALVLMNMMPVKYLAISNLKQRGNLDGSSDVLLNPSTFYQLYHRTFSNDDTLQIKIINNDIQRKIHGLLQLETKDLSLATPDILLIKRSLPKSLNIAQLKSLFPTLQVSWKQLSITNLQRDDSYSGFSELLMNADHIRTVVSKANTVKLRAGSNDASTQVLNQFILEELTQNDHWYAERASNQYQSLPLETLLFFDDEILTPLLSLVSAVSKNEGWRVEQLNELDYLNQLASSIGYEISRYRQNIYPQDFVMLKEQPHSSTHQGVYIFNTGKRTPFILEVPRPRMERQTLEVALQWFDSLNATALFIAGAHPEANSDGSADILASLNKMSLYNIAHQSTLRHHLHQGSYVLQLRAISRDNVRGLEHEILITPPLFPHNPVSISHHNQILRFFKDSHWDYLSTENQAEFAEYHSSYNNQIRYMPMATQNDLSVVWLTPSIRRSFRNHKDDSIEIKKLRALSIVSTSIHLRDYLSQIPVTKPSELTKPKRIDSDIKAGLLRYTATRDISILHQLQLSHPQLQWAHLLDSESGQSFIEVKSTPTADDKSTVLFIYNLYHNKPSGIQVETSGDLTLITSYLHSRQAWLMFGARL